MPARRSGRNSLEDFEKLGMFYLGRLIDRDLPHSKAGTLLYDSKDLLTHAVCVGMTGSGKTGLCIGLLEEAAIDGIPAIAIDPKGDLGNLLLTFPELRAEDFRPWINEDDARRNKMSVEQYATAQARIWKEGLASWGQDGERIARLKAAAEFAIYTPGSSAGVPISVLRAFSAPPSPVLQDAELLHDYLNATVTSVLGLVGIASDLLKSPPHILLSSILKKAWSEGRSLDLLTLIQQVHMPPFERLGALDLESFYPSTGRGEDPLKNRLALAKRLNHLLAAPAFQTWMEGIPLDVGRLLYTLEGKPRVAVISIAHLNDAERMFFVTLLLGQVVAWIRQQTGTSSLRAILYMDEIFGYLPPVANPPSKQPLLTLLKQARAYGLGVVLATQNPVDLDYKALANTGTWFLGRLQTERDKIRVLDGLEGATTGGATRFDRPRMERILAGLKKRVFLLHNVDDEAPTLFETRWTLSYLRGPLTREQIRQAMKPYKTGQSSTSEVAPEGRMVDAGSSTERSLGARPILPPDVPQFFLPTRGHHGKAALIYQPMLLGAGAVQFTERKMDVDVGQEIVYVAPMAEGSRPVNWEQGFELHVPLAALISAPEEPAQYARVPSTAVDAKRYDGWKKDFAAWLGRTRTLEIWRSAALGQQSRPGEKEREFRIRLQQLVRERRDEVSEALRQRYAPKVRALQERIRRAEQSKAQEAEQAGQQYVQTAISVGSALLAAFLGRKAVSGATIGRAATAARGAARSVKETKDVVRAKEHVESLRTQLAELEAQFAAEHAAILQKLDPLTEALDRVVVRPRKGAIRVDMMAFVWVPYQLAPDGVTTPIY